MKNNKGFGTKELAVLILALLLILAGGMYSILTGASKQKVTTFSENALTFSKTVVGNQASFLMPDRVYLQEAIDEGLMKNIKNALGPGNCDPSQSKVITRDGHVYTTLKCGKYLIDNYEVKDVKDVPIYVVSEWQEEKPKAKKGQTIEEKVLYNCMDGSKKAFKEYYEDAYLPYKVGQEYNETLRTLDSIENKTDLNVISETYYRTREKLKVKE